MKASKKSHKHGEDIHKDTHGHAHEHTSEHKKTEKHVEHKPKDSKPASEKKLPGAFYPVVSAVIIILIALLVIFALVRTPLGGEGNGDKVAVEFYVMSQCPYGTQVEDAFYPVLENMGDAVDFHLDYIVRENPDGSFDSLHGQKEVDGNIVQLCAMKYYPEDYKYVEFVVCQNKDAANVNTNWEACAKELGMDSNKLKSCLEGEEGADLLRESMGKASARGASASPTIYINNAPYQGQRDALSFQRAICQVSEHEACESIPACATDVDCTEEKGKIGVCNNPSQGDSYCTYKDPVEVEYILLTAADCQGPACDTTSIVAASQQIFLGAKPRPVDTNSEEGKKLIEDYGIEVVPVYIFDTNVIETKSWKERPDLVTAFDKLPDGKYRLKDAVTGATYFVSEEARQVHYAAIGVVKGDNRPQIDFFVMSYCPYGNQAEEGIEPAFQLLKDKADFNPRYVIYSNYGGGGPNYCIDAESKLCSMHGIQELNQNIREACVNKYMGIDKWFEFALKMNAEATYQNADEKWEGVASGLGLDAAVIKKCFDEEGEALMTADKELGDTLGVSGSPSVFIDGESYGGGRTPEAYKQGLCTAFEDAPEECNTKLEGDSVAASAPAQGSC